MTATRADVEAAVEAGFPATDRGAVLAVLDLYGTEPHEREKDRVQFAIVLLSGGSEGRLLELVQAAKVDYRDVLAWAQTGPLPEAEGRELQRRARELNQKWGR